MAGGNINSSEHIDTTFTKIFVGGLAWETQRDTVRRYFEQFGEILEAVVITDKNTGRSKGYGFVSPIFPFSFACLFFSPFQFLPGFLNNELFCFAFSSQITFKDPEVAMKAVQNPYPIIDGRKTNCNIASIGANKNRRQAPQPGLNLSIFL